MENMIVINNRQYMGIDEAASRDKTLYSWRTFFLLENDYGIWTAIQGFEEYNCEADC